MARRLEPYRAKRDFSLTPEPAPEARPAARTASTPTFMVHKHDATRLHYDLRLEMEGALASWAIPRGPSYDPADKRLAVQTEDHPLAYGDFEGRIPDEEYGGGDSLIWDRGTYQTEPPGQEHFQRAKGHLQLRLDGQKLRGLWHLVRTRPAGDKQQWILFKARDAEARPDYDVVQARPESVVSGRRVTRGPVSARVLRAPHPPPVDLLAKVWPPMLATLVAADAVPQGPFVLEVKYDGFRALASVSGRRVALQSRNALDLSQRFPEVVAAVSRLRVGEAVLDGEVAAFDRQGRSQFGLLQEGKGELRYVVFDLLWLDGEDLRARPVEQRRELLQSVLANADPTLAISEQLPGPMDRALAEARRRGAEGVVLKRAGSPYTGRRGREWLKVKNKATQEVAVVGYVPISTGADQIGALLVAVHERGGLRFAGKVGTGYSAKLRRELFEQLEPRRRPDPPVHRAPRVRGARWVEPGLVAQVEFAEWTRDGLLRQPSFQGLRDDKRPEECVVERPVAAAARSRKVASRSRRTPS